MSGLILILSLSVIVEALIQYCKNVYRWFAEGEVKTAITQILAMILSVLLCLSSGADLFEFIGIKFNWKWVGMILTGILASRGANYVSDFIKKIQINDK